MSAAEKLESLEGSSIVQEVESRGGMKYVMGSTITTLGSLSLEMVKIGILFMAFLTLWSLSGLTLLPFVGIAVLVGYGILYLGLGIEGWGYNPLTQLRNRAKGRRV